MALDPYTVELYETRRRELGRQRDQDLATNRYSRFVAGQRTARQRDDLTNAYRQERETTPNSYAAAGTLRSGLYQQALTDLSKRKLTDFSRLGQDNLAAMQQFDLKDTQIRDNYSSGLADLEALQQAQVAALAAQLRAAKGLA